MANRDVTVDSENPDKVPIGYDKVLGVDVESSPTSALKEFYVSSLNLPRYKIAPSVGSNNLTVAVTHMDGSEPSATKPLYFKIESAVYAVTSALSITIAAGTNWFGSGSSELATHTVPYFVYVVYDSNSSAVALTIARKPHYRVVSSGMSTTTNGSHIYGYSGFTNGDDMTPIGYFEATLSAGAGYTWTVPTFTNANLKHEPTMETGWMTWTPTITGYSANPTFIAQYKVKPFEIEWNIHATGAGTSNAATSTLTLPFTMQNTTNLAIWVNGRGQDNSSECSPTFRILYNTATLDAYKGPGNTAWTGSGTTYYSGQGFYPIS